MRIHTDRVLALLVLGFGLSGGTFAQSTAVTPEPTDEVIVRLRSVGEAPRPAEVVEAVRKGRTVPGGLGVGYPLYADFVLPARLEGRMKAFYDANPDLPRARLERSIVLHYPTPSAAETVRRLLERLPAVEHAEINRPLQGPMPLRGPASSAPVPSPRVISQTANLGPCESTAIC